VNRNRTQINDYCIRR